MVCTGEGVGGDGIPAWLKREWGRVEKFSFEIMEVIGREIVHSLRWLHPLICRVLAGANLGTAGSGDHGAVGVSALLVF